MTQETVPHPRPYAVLVVVAFGLFMTLLDLTIVNIAIPHIVEDLSATLDEVLWMLNAYSLVYAVLLITSGRLGDMFGPRRLFAIGVAIFTIASLLSALAQTPLQLILARAAQGLGAAILAPQALPINLRIFPPERRAAVFAVYGIVSGLAIVLGPTVGGFLVTNFGWPWIFYVNLPIGIAVFVATFVIVPDLRTGMRHRLDWLGVGLATAGLLALVFGLIEGERFKWGEIFGFVTIPQIIAAGGVLLGLFVWSQASRQNREPLLPFGIFADRNFARMSMILFTLGFAIIGVFLPLTIYFQSVLGLSAIDAGLTLAPQSLMLFLASPVIATLINRFGGKWILVIGLALFVLGIAYIAQVVSADGGRWDLLPGLVISGLGMAAVWTPLYDLATRELKHQYAGVASGLLATFQEVGTVVASATIGALLQNRLAENLTREAAARSAALPEPVRAGFVQGFADAAREGFDVGTGQGNAALDLPPGIPEQVVAQIAQIAQAVFAHAFADSMRVALIVPIVTVAVAAVIAISAHNPGRLGAVAAVPGPAVAD